MKPKARQSLISLFFFSKTMTLCALRRKGDKGQQNTFLQLNGLTSRGQCFDVCFLFVFLTLEKNVPWILLKELKKE